ncbi:MAG: uroporphyrinogen-III C-methyltransferase [Planctomycetota bacterium]
MTSARPGVVYLVGAGPGDPSLITVRGMELLQKAEVVVHDRLLSDDLLMSVRRDAEIIPAGKSPDHHTLAQDKINAVLIERAKAGRIVVRLKGGDPYVYGRGSEERAACLQAGVHCEVVPGVSSAISAPAAAGVPVTERGVARSFSIITPAVGRGSPLSERDWQAAACADTLSVLMGCGALRSVASQLIEAGRDPLTPAVLVERATMPGERVVFAPLAEIADKADEEQIKNPAVLTVGEVARPRSSGLPMMGKRVVVTRPRTASYELIGGLRLLGAEVIDAPMIDVRTIDSRTDELVRAIKRRPDWLVCTSRHGVRGLFCNLAHAGLDLRALGGVRIAAVGPTTAAEFRARGVEVDLVPKAHRAEGLIQEITASATKDQMRVLFAAGTLARDELRFGLEDAGMMLDEVLVYETVLTGPTDRVRSEIENPSRPIDAVVLASPSGAKSWVEHSLPKHTCFIAIGPTTARAAEELGLTVSAVASSHTDAGMIEELLGLFVQKPEALP